MGLALNKRPRIGLNIVLECSVDQAFLSLMKLSEYMPIYIPTITTGHQFELEEDPKSLRQWGDRVAMEVICGVCYRNNQRQRGARPLYQKKMPIPRTSDLCHPSGGALGG